MYQYQTYTKPMSNGYTHHHHHHHHSHNQNTTYLPLLCRASTQDIKVAVRRFSGDPSSPRVTCVGNVKRSNKVIGFPTPKLSTTATTAATTTTPTARRSIHNPTYNSTHHHQHQPRFHKPKSAPRTPLKTITAATVATRPGACGLPRGSILISNHSPLRPKTKHRNSSNPPNPSPRMHTTTTPSIHAPARAIILNARPVPKTTFEKSSAGSWMNLNTTVKSNIDYSKLKRLLFPEKINESITRNSSRNREIKLVNNTRKAEVNGESHRNYDVELDPPLPVVKKMKEPGFDREEVNLWKRRSTKTGIELKNLKIQQIHVGNDNHHQIPTTV